ncbi:alkaline phosphatase family protein [Pontibacter sp. BT310]|uniref:Alkaline phosphatase family protein n=1 Tax=Pontibacter populi TaxID=890055 RepID=A0ABS6XEI6_9BACT|nr:MULTISPECIES: alkaline phosphatase D family protein [Pontibacter]MBJ6119545.1 alkaline phosphatase family protein [Pontibacter sp. BT310]MBR0571972.1 alkaline phosphatase family protein [Microvirga sp. STS03]MBW3366398.1 alkaline phosphatase family protein [Pontibacter populi]
MRLRLLAVLYFVCWSLTAVAQEKYLQAGPMVGYSDMREVKLWVQTKAPAKVKIKYWAKDKPGEVYTTSEVKTIADNANATHLVADKVEPGKNYSYELYINNKKVKRNYPLEFKTQELWQHRKDAPDFTFAVGSCFYVNDTPYDRPGKPYGSTSFEILTSIHQKKPDFMLWIGDNTYLREPDWNTKTGIQYRYTHTRSVPELQPLLGSMHNYAIWDDHDYGPNNSDRSFWGKNLTLDAFKTFWANPNYIFENEGITGTFQWNDVQFFLTDDRWFKSPNSRTTDKAYLGEEQLNWLIDALHSSSATFKVICVGGQVLNPAEEKENYSNHPQERQKLLDAIAKAKIKGVIFMDGDRHFTELTKLEREGTYPLYDFTISPLTAGVSDPKNERNTLRVPGTLVREHNFGLVSVSGPATDRAFKVTIYNAKGDEIWQKEIKAAELK